MVGKGAGSGERMEWVSKYKPLYIEWINKVLLYSTGNYIQYPVISHNGKEYEKECIWFMITESLCCTGASLVAQMVKNLPAMQDTSFNPWVRKIPWRREWQPTRALLPGKSHGQRSLEGYSPWGHQESETTEQLTLAVQTKLTLCCKSTTLQ